MTYQPLLPLPGPELIEWIALRRVHTGYVANVAGRWLDYGRPVPDYLPDTLDGLHSAGLVALTAPDPAIEATQRATLTETGQDRYAALSARRGLSAEQVGLEVPPPEHATQTPADQRLSAPAPTTAPGDRPDPTTHTGGDRPLSSDAVAALEHPSAEAGDCAALRWARDPHDGLLHSLASCDVSLAPSRGYAECLCGHTLPADVALKEGPSGALCLPCVVGAVADVPDPGPLRMPM